MYLVVLVLSNQENKDKMSSNKKSIFCIACNGKNFEAANGAYFCESCGLDCLEKGKDFVYIPVKQLNCVQEDCNSNDENHSKNDYPKWKPFFPKVIEEEENKLFVTCEQI